MVRRASAAPSPSRDARDFADTALKDNAGRHHLTACGLGGDPVAPGDDSLPAFTRSSAFMKGLSAGRYVYNGIVLLLDPRPEAPERFRGLIGPVGLFRPGGEGGGPRSLPRLPHPAK